MHAHIARDKPQHRVPKRVTRAAVTHLARQHKQQFIAGKVDQVRGPQHDE